MADEVIRTLVGSIGLIIAAPVTTLFACMVFGGVNLMQHKSAKSTKKKR